MKDDTEWFMPLYFTGKKYVFHDITYLAGRNKKNIKQHLFDPVNNKKFRWLSVSPSQAWWVPFETCES